MSKKNEHPEQIIEWEKELRTAEKYIDYLVKKEVTNEQED